MSALVRPAVSLFVLLSVITGLAYPGLVAGVAQLAFPHQANGSLIVQNGKTVGSSLIGQNFTSPKYFWGRPSATAPIPYNAAASAGSNLGPLNPALTDAVRARAEALHAADPGNWQPIPIELLTASASGLDPHIRTRCSPACRRPKPRPRAASSRSSSAPPPALARPMRCSAPPGASGNLARTW